MAHDVLLRIGNIALRPARWKHKLPANELLEIEIRTLLFIVIGGHDLLRRLDRDHVGKRLAIRKQVREFHVSVQRAVLFGRGDWFDR